MPTPTRKFDNVRATRFSLLIFLSLTAGISTMIFLPIGLARPVQSLQDLSSFQASTSADFTRLGARHQAGHRKQQR